MDKKIAAIQMVSTGNVESNLMAAEKLIASACEQGAKLVLLPENFAVLDGGPLRQYAEQEGDVDARLQNFLSEQSRLHKIILVAGTIPLISRPGDSQSPPSIVSDGRVRPACLVYDATGTIIARYDKIHLFDVMVDDRQAQYSESRSFEPGDQVVSVSTPLGELGLTICYDLRFPELYRQLFDRKVDLVTVPSAFTKTTGIAHWEALLRARAIENQCYVIAANQGGIHNESRETFGHSMIIDPWGSVLGCVPQGEGVVIAEVKQELLNRIRGNMPVASHRRL